MSLEDMVQAMGRERVSVGADSTADEVIRQWVRETLTSGTAKDTFNLLMDHLKVGLLDQVQVQGDRL